VFIEFSQGYDRYEVTASAPGARPRFG